MLQSEGKKEESLGRALGVLLLHRKIEEKKREEGLKGKLGLQSEERGDDYLKIVVGSFASARRRAQGELVALCCSQRKKKSKRSAKVVKVMP